MTLIHRDVLPKRTPNVVFGAAADKIAFAEVRGATTTSDRVNFSIISGEDTPAENTSSAQK